MKLLEFLGVLVCSYVCGSFSSPNGKEEGEVKSPVVLCLNLLQKKTPVLFVFEFIWVK